MTEKKDPYLSELDQLDDLNGLGEEPTKEEPTKPLPPKAKKTPPKPAPAGPKEVASLSPDIPVELVVVMARKDVTVKDLLTLGDGQVVELDRLPHEAVDLVASGKVIAKGELVEIEGKLGVRIIKLVK